MVQCPKCEKYKGKEYWKDSLDPNKYYRCIDCGHYWHVGRKDTPPRSRPNTIKVIKP
jgi:Zn ribbon nucleic-acid-binding protein